MNIFVLDINPILAAQYQCDKHIVKMTLETAQILSTVHHRYNSNVAGLYKATHINHPCVKWAGDTVENYCWLAHHFSALAEEYKHRYNKEHKSWVDLGEALTIIPKGIPFNIMSPFALAMPDEYKDIYSPVESYRNYYRGSKKDICKYTNRLKPNWL